MLELLLKVAYFYMPSQAPVRAVFAMSELGKAWKGRRVCLHPTVLQTTYVYVKPNFIKMFGLFLPVADRLPICLQSRCLIRDQRVLIKKLIKSLNLNSVIFKSYISSYISYAVSASFLLLVSVLFWFVQQHAFCQPLLWSVSSNQVDTRIHQTPEAVYPSAEPMWIEWKKKVRLWTCTKQTDSQSFHLLSVTINQY